MATNLSGLVKKLQDIMRSDPGINGDAQRIEQIIWALFLKVYDAKEEDWEMDEDEYHSVIPEKYRWQNWAHDDGKGTVRTGEELLDFVTELFTVLKNLPITPDMPKNKKIVRTMFEETNQYMKDGVLLRQVINVIDGIDLESYENMHALGDIYETILRELQSAGRAGEFYTPRAVTDFMAERIEPHLGEVMADFACGTGGFLVSWLRELEKQIKTPKDRELWNDSVYGIEKKQFPYMLAITNLLLHDIDNPNIDHGNSLLHDVLDYTEKDKFDKILMNPPYGGSEKKDVMSHFPDDLADSETADLFMSVILYRLKQGGRAAVVLPDGFLFGTDNTKVNIKKKLMAECDLHTIIRLPGSVFAPYTSITTNILFFDRTHPTEKTWFYRLDMPEGYKHFSKTKPMRLEHFEPVREWWDDRREIIEGDFPKAKCYTAEEIADNGYNLDLCGFPHEEEEILEPMELIQQYQTRRAALNQQIDTILARITAKLEENE
ncbi:N-6 DNA methylase [Megasphaera sp.]|jgi:type I restriction enzyme M protein|uniref:class I SAM-dependent DNA methyltransferase n=1 Tax=Megasphaera sp. TaxID=2023260 RepID=UPI003AB1AE98